MAVLRWLSLCFTAAGLLAASSLVGGWSGSFEAWIHLIIVTAVAGGALVLGTTALWSNVTIGRRWMLLVMLAGVLFRVVAMPAGRELSDDAARYHWDGKVLAHGINPYRFAPDDPQLDHLRGDDLDTRINHSDLRTVYPPLAQGFFALAYRLSPGKLVGLPLLVLFLRAAQDCRSIRAGVYLALACLIKPLPLILVPAAVRWLGCRGSLRLAAGFIGVTVLC